MLCGVIILVRLQEKFELITLGSERIEPKMSDNLLLSVRRILHLNVRIQSWAKGPVFFLV